MVSYIDPHFYCILDNKALMAQTFLQLNQDKTEILIISSKAQKEKLAKKLCHKNCNLSLSKIICKVKMLL